MRTTATAASTIIIMTQADTPFGLGVGESLCFAATWVPGSGGLPFGVVSVEGGCETIVVPSKFVPKKKKRYKDELRKDGLRVSLHTGTFVSYRGSSAEAIPRHLFSTLAQHVLNGYWANIGYWWRPFKRFHNQANSGVKTGCQEL